MVLKRYWLFSTAVLSFIASTVFGQAAEIVLDPETTFQTMSGWEATADLPDNPAAPVWAPYRQEMLDRVVTEVGINRLRLEIRSGAESSTGVIRKHIAGEITFDQWEATRYKKDNDNDDPFNINWNGFDFAELDWHIENTILPIRKRMAAQGETLIVNLCYVNFSEPGFHANADEYAEFVLATYLHMQEKYGLVPDMWEVILEPDIRKANPKADRWSGEMMGHAMVATAARLRDHGFDPSFVAPSVTNIKNTLPFAKAIASVPGALEDFDELSYHRYWSGWPEILAQISDFADQHDMRVSMLEWWFGKATHEILHEDLTIGNNSAWQGRVARGLHQPPSFWQTKGLRLQPEVRYNLQYFRHVRHGAIRIGAITDRPGIFDPVAFINTDGRYTVVVKSSQGGPISVTGLPPGKYNVSYAVKAGSVEESTPVTPKDDGHLTTAIPAAGVLTIAAQ